MVRGRKDEREEDGSIPCEGVRYRQEGLLVRKHEIFQEISILATQEFMEAGMSHSNTYR